MEQRRCPYCQTTLDPSGLTTSCQVCAATHHAECWAENRGCAIPLCAGGPAERSRPPIVVEPVSVATMSAPPTAGGGPDLPDVNWPQGVPIPIAPRRQSGSSNTTVMVLAIIVTIVIVAIIAVVLAKKSNRPYGAAPSVTQHELAWHPAERRSTWT